MGRDVEEKVRTGFEDGDAIQKRHGSLGSRLGIICRNLLNKMVGETVRVQGSSVNDGGIESLGKVCGKNTVM